MGESAEGLPSAGKTKGKSALYLPKRSTVLGFCFMLATITSAQYHLLDGLMETLLRDEEVTEFLKLDQHMLELAVHWGFLVTPLLSALFVVRTGAGRILTLAGALFSTFSTFLFPLVGRSLLGMMWARALAGAGQGMVLIGLIHLLMLWMPRQEYTRALTLVGSGYYAGMMVADVWGGVISRVYSWQATFYWFSVVPALLLALWAYVVAAHPAAHPTISPTELAFLRANCAPPEPAPWRLQTLVHSPTFWLLVGVTALYQFAHVVVFSISPFFVMDVFWVDLSFPLLCAVLVYYNAAAMAFDHFLQQDRADASGKWSRRPREAVGCVGLVGAALFFKLFCGVSHTSGVRFLAFLLALACFSHAYAGHIAATLEVLPRHAPLVWGFAMVPGAFLQMWGHVGSRWVLDSTGNWSFIWSSVAASLALAGVLWGSLGSTERIPI